ncbi:MAG TPA: class I SAM-dependent methyltransferase [Hyphomicrobium sp.]|nr:class I SAM-dependent methyltransferase [Hyphomicrobium sp.]
MLARYRQILSSIKGYLPASQRNVSQSRREIENLRRVCLEINHDIGAIRESLSRQQSLAEGQKDNRVILLDYPIRPRKRSYEDTIAGKELISLFSEHEPRYRQLLQDIASYGQDLRAIGVSDARPMEPNWVNGWLPGLDSALIYTLIRKNSPRIYLEVGSGNSTKFARRAIMDGMLDTTIISIDPHPRAEIDAICDEIVRQPLEDMDQTIFNRLTAGDVLFVDNSHRCFQSSDVTVFFTEILPTLAEGVIWGIHDILLPYDYPNDWLDRFYSEQYVLASYLLGGHKKDEVIFPAMFVSKHPVLSSIVEDIFSDPHFAPIETHGGAFWMQRKC